MGAVHAIAFGPVAYRALYRSEDFEGPNLFQAHTVFTGYVFDGLWRPATPGYLWQVTARLATEATGSGDLRAGAVIASAAFSAFFGVAIYEVYRQSRDSVPPLVPVLAALASLAVAMFENPAALSGWSEFEQGRIFLPLYLPFAPTTIGSLALNVLVLLAVADLIDGRLTGRRRWRVPLLMVLATIGKPTLTPLIVAAISIAAIGGFLIDRARGRSGPSASVPGGGTGLLGAIDPMTAVRLIVVPGVAVLIPQFLVTATKVQYPGSGYDDRGGWRVHPLAELGDLNALTPYFWLVLVFPLAAFALTRTGLWRDTAVRIATAATALGIVAAMLLERTESIWKGDMLQLPGAAVAMLMVFIPRRVIELRRSGEVSALAFSVLALTLAPSLVAGVWSWSCRVGLGCPAI